MKVAQQRDIPAFIVMEVMKQAAEREAAGGDVLHMEVGQPATPAPQGVIEAAKNALDHDRLGYTLALGIPELRQAIAEHYSNFYGVTLPSDRIAVTTGSSGAFLTAFLAAFDPGDKVAILRPGYPCYRNILSSLNIEPVDVPVGVETRFQPTPDLLEAAGGANLDGLLLASPANPTGSMLSEAELSELLNYCKDRNIRYISDEIYHGISFEDRTRSALEIDSETLVINSFSKYFSMTGWRLGWMVLPEELITVSERLMQNFFISAPSLSQIAGVAAFDCHEELQSNVQRYSDNRDVLLRELPRAGFKKLAPADGAFYIYADVSDLTDNAETFCADMLLETGVATTPGTDFDPVDGRRFVRFSFAGATAEMVEAADRLNKWLQN